MAPTVYIKADATKAIQTIKDFDTVVSTSIKLIGSYDQSLKKLNKTLASMKINSNSISNITKQTVLAQVALESLYKSLNKVSIASAKLAQQKVANNQNVVNAQTAATNNQAKAQQKAAITAQNLAAAQNRAQTAATNLAAAQNRAALAALNLSNAQNRAAQAAQNMARHQGAIQNVHSFFQRAGIAASNYSVNLNQAGTAIRSIGLNTRLTTAQMSQLTQILQRAGMGHVPINQLNQSVQGLNSSIKSTITGFLLAGAAATAFGATTLFKEILDNTVKFQAMNSTLLSISNSVEQAGSDFSYVKNVAKTFGISLESVAQSYAKFYSAANAVGLSAKDTKYLFEGVAKASTVLHLSLDDTKGVMKAFTDILSKGKLQAEELRGQLGDRFPMAMALAAKAFQKEGETMEQSMARLQVEMKKGEITGKAFAKAIAPELDKAFSGQALEAAKGSLQAALNNMSTMWFEVMSSIGLNSEKNMKMIVDSASIAIKELGQLGPTIKTSLGIVGVIFTGLAKSINEVVNILIFGLVPAIAIGIKSMGGFALSIKAVGTAFKSMTASMGHWGLILTGLAIAVGLVVSKIQELNYESETVIREVIEQSVLLQQKLRDIEEWAKTASMDEFEIELSRVKLALEEAKKAAKDYMEVLHQLPNVPKHDLFNREELKDPGIELDFGIGRNIVNYLLADETDEYKEQTEKIYQNNKAKMEAYLLQKKTIAQTQVVIDNNKALGETDEQRKERLELLKAQMEATSEAANDLARSMAQDFGSAYSDLKNNLKTALNKDEDPLKAIDNKWDNIINKVKEYSATLEPAVNKAIAQQYALADAEIAARGEELKPSDKVKIYADRDKAVRSLKESLGDLADATKLLNQTEEAREREKEKVIEQIRQETIERNKAQNNLKTEIKYLRENAAAYGVSTLEQQRVSDARERGIKINNVYNDILKETGNIEKANAAALEYASALLIEHLAKQRAAGEAADQIVQAKREQIDAIIDETNYLSRRDKANADYERNIQNIEKTRISTYNQLRKAGVSAEEAIMLARMEADALIDRLNTMEDIKFEQQLMDGIGKLIPMIEKLGSRFSSSFGKIAGAIGNAYNSYQNYLSAQEQGDRTGQAVAGAQMGMDIGTVFGGGDPGNSKYGGKNAGNYASEGGAIGGAIFGPWGAILGAALGSLVKTSADKAIIALEAKMGEDISATLMKDEGPLGKVLTDWARGINDFVSNLEGILGQELIFDDILIQIREDVVTVFLEGLNSYRHEFETEGEAIAFAIAHGLQKNAYNGTISDAMSAALMNTQAQTLEELQKDIQIAFDIENFGLNDFQKAMRALSVEMQVYIKNAERLHIPLENIFREWENRLKKTRESILGIEEDYATKVKREAAAFNEERAKIIADQEKKLTEWFAKLGESAKNAGLDMNDLISGPGSFKNWATNAGQFTEDFAAMFTEYADIGLAQFSETMFQVGEVIGMTAWEIQDKIDELQRFLAGLPPLITDAEIDEAIRRGPSGGGSSSSGDNGAEERAQRRLDFWKELALMERHLSPMAEDIAKWGEEIAAKYKELVELGGGITEGEIQKYLDILKSKKIEEFTKSIMDELAELSGKSWQLSFTNIQKDYADRMSALIELQNVTGIDQNELARAIERWRLLKEEALITDALSAIGDSETEIRSQFEDMGEAIRFLQEQLDQGRIDADRFGRSIQNLHDRLVLDFGDKFVGFFEKYYGKTKELEDFKMHLEELRFKFELTNMKLQFQLLQQMQLLTTEEIAAIQALFDQVAAGPPTLPGSEPETPTETPDNSNAVNAAEERENELNRLREAIRKQIENWTETSLNGIEKTLNDITKTFDDLKAQWIKAGGKLHELIELEKAMAIARENAIKQAFSGVKTLFETIRDRDLVNDPLKGLNQYRRDFDSQLKKFRGGKLDPDNLLKSAQEYYNSISSVFGEGVGGERMLRELENQLKSVLLSAGYDPSELTRSSDPIQLAREGNDINRKMLYELQLMNGTITKAEYDKLIRDSFFIRSNSDSNRRIQEENVRLRQDLLSVKNELKTVMIQTRDAIVNTHIESKNQRKTTNDELQKLNNLQSDNITKKKFGGM